MMTKKKDGSHLSRTRKFGIWEFGLRMPGDFEFRIANCGFVLIEPVGNARHYRINAACIDCFPSAADLVMGRPAPSTPGGC